MESQANGKAPSGRPHIIQWELSIRHGFLQKAGLLPAISRAPSNEFSLEVQLAEQA